MADEATPSPSREEDGRAAQEPAPERPQPAATDPTDEPSPRLVNLVTAVLTLLLVLQVAWLVHLYQTPGGPSGAGRTDPTVGGPGRPPPGGAEGPAIPSGFPPPVPQGGDPGGHPRLTSVAGTSHLKGKVTSLAGDRSSFQITQDGDATLKLAAGPLTLMPANPSVMQGLTMGAEVEVTVETDGQIFQATTLTILSGGTADAPVPTDGTSPSAGTWPSVK